MTKKLGCIIDDDQIYLTGISKMIEIHKLCDALLVYRNGEEALTGLTALVQNHEAMPQTIMLDLNMPIMDGWEFLDRFSKVKALRPGEINIYVVSSSINPSDIEHAKRYTAVSDYVIKPVTIDSLKQIFQ